MPNYDRMYRLHFTPWEHYSRVQAETIKRLLDREEADRPLGRALDLGCGRGMYAAELARRGWHVVGVDAVPIAIEAARRHARHGEVFANADVTSLPSDLGTFDFFLDVGCLASIKRDERAAYGTEVTAHANEGATLLTMQFGDSRYRRVVPGVSQEELIGLLPDWELIATEPAGTKGLGWPMRLTSPMWYRLRRR